MPLIARHYKLYAVIHCQYVGKRFYLIICSDKLTKNFLFSINFLANNENAKYHKCERDMSLYLRKERGKERRVLRYKGKECETTQRYYIVL